MKSISIYERYARSIAVPEFGMQGQDSISASSILIVGVGGLGCHILQHAAAMGIKKIGLVDHDIIALCNLQRQIIYSEKNVGRAKVKIAKKYAEDLNSEIEIIDYDMKLTFENASELISQYDVVMDACDNFETRYIVNDVCVRLNKVFIYGAATGMRGQCCLFKSNKQKNLRNCFSRIPITTQLDSCSSDGVLSPIVGIIASMQTYLLIRYLAQILPDLSGILYRFENMMLKSSIIV